MKNSKKLSFQEHLKSLEQKIKNTYEAGVTLDEAEKLAAEFLHAQLIVSAELTKEDLNCRMNKSGNKAIRAGTYINIVSESEGKRPTEAQIAAIVESDEAVKTQQSLLDSSEVTLAELERYYNIFLNAHIFYRAVAKGTFGN